MFKAASIHNTTTTTHPSLFQNEKGENAFIQPKLNIGKAGDKYEVEADRMADTIIAKGKDDNNVSMNPLPSVQQQSEEVQQDTTADLEVQEKPFVENNISLIQPQSENSEELQEQPEKEIQKKESEDQVLKKEESETLIQHLQKQEEEHQPLEEVQTKPETDIEIQQKQNVETTTAQIQRQSEEEVEEVQKQPEKEIQEQATEEIQTFEPEKQVQKEPEHNIVAPDIQKQDEDIQELEEEEEIQEKEEIKVQAKADGVDNSANIENNLNSSTGGGSPLPKNTQSQMESGFGTDFSGVRIHTDANAVQMNKDLGAQAFTHGNDIYFNEGKYDTSSTSGQHLLAHELTHTVQQGAVIRKKNLNISSNSSVPDIQRIVPVIVAPVVTPVIVFGGSYLTRRLAKWGIKKIFEEEKEMVDYSAIILKELRSIPIDLKGQSKFSPPSYIAKHIQTFGLMSDWYLANKEVANKFGIKFKNEILEGPKLNIKFGTLGSRNEVPIRWHESTQTYEMDPHFMHLKHSAFSTEGKKLVPHLALGIDKADSSVYGGIAPLLGGPFSLRAKSKALMRKMMNKEELARLVFGEDYDKESFKDVIYINDVLAGGLHFQLAGYQNASGNQTLIGAFVLINDVHAWSGNIQTQIKGISNTEIPIERDSKSRITGALSGLSLAGDWNIKVGNFTGTLEASYINGLLDIRGDVTYSSDRIPQANLTLWVTTKQQAWEAAEKRLPPEAKQEDRKFENEDELAITGWGSMDVIIIKDKPQKKGKGGAGATPDDNFLTGKVAAVIDPDGFLTMSGEMIFSDKVRLLNEIGGDMKDVYKKGRQRLAYVNVYPGIGVRVMAEAYLKLGYQIGPVELYEISIKGIYSNNPNINKQLEFTTRINGVAGLKAEAGISGAIELRLGTRWNYLGVSPADVKLGVNATGELRGYMDFAPTIGVKKGNAAEKDAENIPKYFFKGSLTVGGELDIVGAFIASLSVVGTDFKGEYPFAKRTIPGAAVTMDWDYILGDPITMESLQKMTKIKKGKFNPPKMMREMFKKQKAKETDQLKGGFKEGKKEMGTIDDEKIPIPENNTPEREVKDDFRMLGTIHHLILQFEEGDKPPKLKMASNPELILKKVEIARNRLSAEIPDLDADDAKLMEDRLKDLEKIKTAANKVIKHATQLGVGMSKLKKSNVPGFEELGDLISDYGTRYGVDDLSGILTKTDTPGTQENPFEIVWPKPRSANYEPLYFGGRLDKPRSQGIMKGLYAKGAKDSTGNKVKKYTPHVGGTLSGGEKIGISRGFRTFDKRIVGPLSTEGTPGGGKLNRILKKYGYLPGRDGDGMDADHIVEIQFGGKDVVANLWPLDSDINQESGRTLKDAKIMYPKTGKEAKIKDLKQKLRKYYFRIIRFEY
ncbi:eCIS core domain-containing protein [Aquimarina sp. 2201CG5-10]|uniref:eCIS core domain-containing protein n=1 Tax=Aquimarina callyspongiae TaxID=3098150 RepID=UPI002AB5B2AA|nr:DUF4157 domain-containing protein [Aquimarina sp. 2201CG5-10]MDY8138083.1 DUF4157 domain-containing protein [Aquimarina sp. 2201CG5-10]